MLHTHTHTHSGPPCGHSAPTGDWCVCGWTSCVAVPYSVSGRGHLLSPLQKAKQVQIEPQGTGTTAVCMVVTVVASHYSVCGGHCGS